MAIDTPAIEGGGEVDQVRFLDEPLDDVARDNIEIDCIIGPGPLNDDREPQNGKPYYVTELEVHLTEGTESNYAMGKVVPDGHNRKPDEGNPLKRDDDPDLISIDIDNSLMAEREGTSEITRIFTGSIANSSRIEHGLFEFIAFWPGFNRIQNGSRVFTPPPAATDEFTLNGKTFRAPEYGSSLQPAKFVADELAEYVTTDTPFDFTINLQRDGFDIGGTTYADNINLHLTGEEVPITASGADEGMLQRIINATNSVWMVDRYGDFHIGPPIPVEDNSDIPTAITAHKLRYITDTSAGLQSPAYRSIVVLGDGVVSKDGWDATALINENPQEYADSVTTSIAENTGTEDLAEPTFTYTNMEIDTAEEAQHVLDKLKEEIRKQMASGTVTVVGHPEVWPGDAIEMPDSRNQPFGLERYAVRKVTHRVNNSDGFITKIETMGQTNAAESVFSDEIEVPDDPSRYDSNFTEDELRRVKNQTGGL